MNHLANVAARRVEDYDDLDGQPGAFQFTGVHGQPDDVVGGLIFCCPCGCNGIKGVSFQPWKPAGWTWDGNRDAPTVDPSIRCLNGCKWHGHLRAGVFVPCGDSGQ